MPPEPLVGMHTYACVSVLSRANIILLQSCFPPSHPQLKILYETLSPKNIFKFLNVLTFFIQYTHHLISPQSSLLFCTKPTAHFQLTLIQTIA